MSSGELQQVGPYTITQLLAEGSTSKFYLARHQQRKKDAVIKILLAPLTTNEAKETFLARARQLKKLKHRHIIEIQDFGLLQNADGEPDCGYMVMQYAAGGSISKRIAPGQRIPADEVKRILSPIADALHYAHVNNIVHGNLHPGNLLLVGDHNETLLTDFSYMLQSVLPSFDGETAALLYKAPEHLQGTCTAASDQYALAVMAYEWLCGRRPYEATETGRLLYLQEHEPLPPPRGLNENISPALEGVLLQALAHNPDERFPHAQAFANAYLHALMGLPVNVKTQHIASSPTTPTTPATLATLPTNITTNKSITELARNSVAKLLPLNHLLHQHYCIIGLLGQGGGGAVYKAQDTKLGDRLVAIKELRQDSLNSQEINEAIKAFKQEAKLLAGLIHQSLPSIYEHFDEAERCYFVMDFIEGETLEEYLNKAVGRRLPVEEVLDIGIRLCSVLSYLHMHEPQVIFRDLKPANIMRNSDGHLYLIDFGIARHFKPGKAKDTTIFGTKGYAAPEQYGRAQTTPRSDIYSLGATLHQLLSGEDPTQNLLVFAPLRLGNQSALVELEALIMQMVEIEASKRPVSISSVKQELQRISAGYTTTLQTGVTQRIQPPIILRRSNPLQAAGGIPSAGNTLYHTPTEPLAQHVSPPPTDSSSLGQIVSADLCQGGILSRRLPGYEERPAQIEMAGLVARSLMENKHAIAEAATGTGKSLAYLVPIVRSGKVAIISTANKALQEQLFYKDIPFVQKNIKYFAAALVKGMGNYVCRDRLENERVGTQFYAKNRDFMRLLKMTEEEDSTFDGDFETLGFPLPADIRSKVNADRDQCAWSKCNFFADCYVRKMKVKASNAQIIVVNHTLLLLDAAMEGYLLPERDVIVVDEAHHLEEEATRCFTITVSPLQVSTLLAQSMLKAHSPVSLQDEANQVMMEAWERLAKVADPGIKGRDNLRAPLEEGLHLASIISRLADALLTGRPKDLPEKESQLYDKLLARTQNLADNVRAVFSVAHPDKFVYYVERIYTPGRRGGQLETSAAPLDITTWLQKHLFSKSNVICTSATLATVGTNPVKLENKGPNFAYFRRRTGLDYVEYPNTLERILPLTFDYESNALLYLPRDLPEPVYGPGSLDYAKKIADRMRGLVEASRGRAFLLFSSKRMLEEVYELLVPHLDFPLLRQGDLPRIELTRKFRQEAGAVLFGLKSFWEGVDIAGEALSLVVIDKLPFDPPDDPVHEARVAQMKAAGENWFGTYVLPQAVLRLKQGLGRLLRTREDRGVMAILDARLHTKSYGRTILAALPPARRTASLKEVERFFSEEPAPF